jgi:hypothetical protein
MAQVKHALFKRRALALGRDKKKRAKNRIESTEELPVLLGRRRFRAADANESENDNEDEGSDGESVDAGGDAVNAWLRALGDAAAEDDDSDDDDDISSDNDNISDDDAEEEDDDDDAEDEDPPETQDPNMQPLPEENDPNYPQENVKYFLNKRYVRKDKLSLERFMVLANITSTNTDDHDIEFPELYEIYK